MIEIREALTRREQREFLNFPLELYKDEPCFVPPLWMDEKKIFKKNYVYYDTCEAVYYNAYKDGRMVGRISGILQKAANEKNGERRVRFTRFDSINDTEVAKALFGAVEKWALEKGMDTVCGPLGFSDLEREGLLIEGFDKLSTFEEQYNYEYYGSLIEACGYGKEVDWTESMIFPPENDDGALKRVADKLMKRYDLHWGPAKNVNDFLNKYADGLFELLDKSYDQLYGTVPFTPGMKKLMIDNFRLIIDLDHVAVILDKDDNVVCLGVCFPSIAEAVRPSKGHLTPAAVFRILRAMKKPEIIDLGLIGVDPAWAMRGVSVAISAELERMLRAPGIKYAETNLNLEDNLMIQNQWKRFVEVKHKRRRAYVKKLEERK
ncbi:MAG: N-acetyltransferase [Clostridia bacterium]|nr:N-acetyltransferase [Clostridia bacterium]MBR3487336.1 N-acetyltransferase [Clostridia bacterium]